MNLLAIPWMRRLLRSRLYPAVFQWIAAGGFGIVLLCLLFGVNNPGQNFGMAFTWTVWWPLLPLSFLLLGRFWCAVCPLAWVIDLVQKRVGVRLPAPSALRRYGPWIMAALFVLVSYLDAAWRFGSDARKSGYLLLAMLSTVIFFGAFFDRRTFCRHVCFLGPFAASYSRAGILELRADPATCGECTSPKCYRGTDVPGCPVFLYPPDGADSATCHLCANCLKNCPRDAIRISVRKPLAGLWFAPPRLSDAVFVAIVAGAVLLQRFAMLSGFPLLYAGLIALLAAVCLVGTNAYALLPLVLASHLACGLDTLLTRCRTAPFALAASLGWFPANSGAAWLSPTAACWMEALVLTAGAAVALYAIRRLASRVWPSYALALALLAANLYPLARMMR